MRDEKDAHYQHDKTGLRAVLSPPLERPRAVAWVGRSERLLVATEEGALIEVDPVFGTRNLQVEIQDPAEMAVSPDGKLLALVERGHGVSVHRTGNGECVAQYGFPVLSDISVCWFQLRRDALGIAVAGDDLDGRRVAVMSADLKRRRIARVPRRTAIGTTAEGALVCARVTRDGMHVLPFGRPLPAGSASKHRLRFGESGAIMGIAEGGVTIWSGPGAAPKTIMVYDVSAATLDPTGDQVSIGTRSGEVAMSEVSSGGMQRARPGKVGGHSSAIRAMAFARKGKWLATASEELRLWTW
ncbi:MAG: hypothetical protein H6739_30595 [Alphaproteobacteria bacterium]|nr:hypothetical protein [Alphaproteobacteria bacterium]